MKKIMTYSMATMLLIVAASCKKSLELPNKSAYTYDTYFASAEVLDQAVIATYSTLLHQGLWSREYYFIFDLLGYDAKNNAPLQGDLLQLAQYNFGPAQPQLDQFWASLYRIVYRANVVIDRAAAWTPANETETKKQQQYIAEAKFLRAYAYFNLAAAYGRVPLRTSYQQIVDEENYLPRAPVEEVWALVEKDLQEAAPILPLAYDAAQLGRATQGAAIALLGKAYLYQKKWDQAQTELTKLTTGPFSYALADNYSDLFSTENQNNSETIFQVMNQEWTDWGVGNQYYMFGGQEFWGNKATHTGRAQEYGFNDWKNILVTTTAVRSFTYPNPQTGAPYADTRAKFTFYGDAASGGQTQYCQSCAEGPIDYPFAASGYSFLKYQYYDKVKSYGGPQSGINGQVIRYADVLLMLAETYIQQGNTGAAPLALINQVRGRASVKAPAYSSLGGQTEALAILQRERRLELTGEQSRYFDLVRWGIAKQVINAERQAEDGTQPFQDRNLLLPIPVSERNTNPNVANDVANDWN